MLTGGWDDREVIATAALGLGHSNRIVGGWGEKITDKRRAPPCTHQMWFHIHSIYREKVGAIILKVLPIIGNILVAKTKRNAGFYIDNAKPEKPRIF